MRRSRAGRGNWVFAISLGDDGAELRPLEPWHAGEYLAHMDRGREYIGRYVALPDRATDLVSATAFLQTYADKAAADTGRLYGIWSDGVLVGGVLFVTFDDLRHLRGRLLAGGVGGRAR